MRCIRLLVADFIPSAPYEVTGLAVESAEGAESRISSPESSSRCTFDYSYVEPLASIFYGLSIILPFFVWRKQDHDDLNFVGFSGLARFINKPADGGVTALHMAALNGYSDCVQLLLDLHASASAVTFHYGSAINLIGTGNFSCP